MDDAETLAEWAKREPQRSFIECAEKLQDQGHSIDAMIDSLLGFALHMAHEIHGPRAVAGRLLDLAQKFTNEANEADAVIRTEWGNDGPH